MSSVIASIFGTKKAKPQGPSQAALAAQAAQERQLEEQEAKEKRKARATRAVIGARSGRGQGVTLNPRTGERGVIAAGKLGGA